MWHLNPPGHRVLHQLQQLSRVGPLRAGQAFRAALEVDSARIQPGAPNSTEGMDGPIDTIGRQCGWWISECRTSRSGLRQPGLCRRGLRGPGLLQPGIRPGRLLPRRRRIRANTGAAGVYRHELPELRHDQSEYSPLLLPLRLCILYGGLDPYAGYYTSPASQAAQDRAARKAYRRSLPPLYRWRRVIIGVAVAALLIAAGVLLRSDPVGIVKGAWYGLRQEYVWVKPVQATVIPPEATAPKSDPAALVDESENEWTMNWTPTGESACGPAPGTGFVVLTFAPTRIRLIQIAPGLAESNPQRKLQPLPHVVGIAFDDGKCHSVNLTATPNQQEFKIDSGKPVTRVLIGIGSAYPAANGQPLISLTEVIFEGLPQLRVSATAGLAAPRHTPRQWHW